jgi:peroxiredoxin/uncharacterized membrane protein YgaE (UPF0421/DUF939 family)
VKLAISDPGRFALKNAARAAIAVPAGLALGLKVFDLPEMGLFAAFGSVALLVFVDFGGERLTRLLAYLALVAVGAVLIAVGTLCSQTTWLAVVAMALVGFVILFAGVLDGYVAAAQNAAILAFVLAAMVPADPSAIPTRLAGWGLAALLSLAAVFLLWPRRPRDQLRTATIKALDALAALLEARAEVQAGGGGLSGPAAERLGELSAEAYRDVAAAHQGFVANPHRPTGIGARTAAAGRLIDDIDWFDQIARRQPAPPATSAGFATARTAVEFSVPAALREASRRLSGADAEDDAGTAELDRVTEAHADIGAAFLGEVTTAAEVADRAAREAEAARLTAELDEVYRLRALAYGALQIGRHALQASGAPAPPDPTVPAAMAAGPVTRRLARSHASLGSVWLRNSLRGAAGLAIAVLVARVADTQNGFWVVLGTLSVLRSSALATGATVVQAIEGTVVGIVAGGLIVWALGDHSWLLWVLLPFAVLLAAYSPRAISFAAGQAGFTTVIVILFNLINPVGWSVGVVRIEDVAIGCAVSLLAGLLLWPRGAAEVLRAALGDAYVSAARYLDQTISSLLGGDGEDRVDAAARDASETALRLDETMREYLAEKSSARGDVDGLARLVGGAATVRRVARQLQDAHQLAPLAPLDARAPWVAEACGVFDVEWRSRRAWFERFGGAITAGAEPPAPEHDAPPLEEGATRRRARAGDAMSADYSQLPPDLPVPEDDGAADHLEGMALPALRLPVAQGGEVDLAELGAGLAVLYVYPHTGVPGEPLPAGWNEIPGARGCTPQSCAYRDAAAEFAALGARLAGLSAQDLGEQRDFAVRERIAYPLLNDSGLELAATLRLPTFELAETTFYRRLTLVARSGRIVKVFYPVFPPDRDAAAVLAWLRVPRS